MYVNVNIDFSSWNTFYLTGLLDFEEIKVYSMQYASEMQLTLPGSGSECPNDEALLLTIVL